MKLRFHQTATHWALSSKDGYGSPTFSAPVSVACRWEDGAVISRSHAQEAVNAVAAVCTASAVNEGDYMYLGTSTATTPLGLAEAWEVKKTGKRVRLNGQALFYIAFLGA